MRPAEGPAALCSSRSSVLICFLSTVLYNETRDSFSSSVHKKQYSHPHHQIRRNQQDKEPVAPVKARGLLKNALPVGTDREPIEISRNIQRHLLDVGIALRGRRRSRLCANGRQRFIKAASTRDGSYLRLAGEQEPQQRTERKDVAAR